MLNSAMRALLWEEFKAWSALAGPVALSRFSELLPWLVQLIIVGHVGVRELAALSLMETWLYPFMICLWTAVGTALSTLVSQAHGSRRLGVARGWGVLALGATAAGSVLATGAWLAGKPVLDALGFDPALTTLAQSYTLWALPALWLEGFNIVVGTYLEACQIVLPPLALALLACGVDIAVCVLLVFGWPAVYSGMQDKLAGLGIGWSCAALTSTLGSLLLLWLYTGRELEFGHEEEEGEEEEQQQGQEGKALALAEGGEGPVSAAHALNSSSLEEGSTPLLGKPSTPPAGSSSPSLDLPALLAFFTSCRRWRSFGGQALPALATSVLSNTQFTVISLLAATLGPTALATHNTVLCLFEVVATAGAGMTEATATRVGFHVGRGDAPAAQRTALVALAAGTAWGAACAAAGIPLRHAMGQLFTSDPGVLALTAQIAPWMWGGYAVLSAGDIALGVMAGVGAAREESAVFLLGVWGVGLPLAVASLRCTQWGLQGLWAALVAGYLVLDVLAFVVVWRMDWEKVVLEARERAAEEEEEGGGEEEEEERGGEGRVEGEG